MKKTYLKTIIREIKQSFGRFVAIFAIVALGVGFLAGLLATTPDMQASVDQYYDKNHMADIFIKGTMGLTEADIKAISPMDKVEEIMPAYVTDTLMKTNNHEVLATRVYGLPLDKLKNNDAGFINRLELIDGRMPLAKNECLVERRGSYLSEIKLGTTLTVSEENKDYINIGDTYNTKQYTVVGIVGNPFYFSMEVEATSIGNGRIGAIMYVDESCYALDVYTDFYITATGADVLNAFSDEYDTWMKKIVAELEMIGKKQSLVRRGEIVAKGIENLEKAKVEYEDGKREAKTKFAEAWQEIQDKKRLLAEAAQEIEDGKKDIADAKITLKKESEDGQKKIDAGKMELNDALAELKDGEQELADNLVLLEDGQREYKEGYAEYLKGRQKLEDGQAKFDQGEQEYLNGVAQLAAANEQIRNGETELASAKADLDAGQAKYDAGMQELKIQKDQFGLLIGQILSALNDFGLNYASADELFQALELEDNPTAGAISTTVTAILTGSRNEIESQITQLKTQIIGLEEQILKIEEGELPLPEGKTLEEIKEELVSAKNVLSDRKAALQALPVDAVGLQNTWKALKAGEVGLQAAYEEILLGRGKYVQGQQDLIDAKSQYELGKGKLEEAHAELEANRAKLVDGWAELEVGQKELDDALVKLKDGETKAKDGRKELNDGWRKYNHGIVELADAQETLNTKVAEANQDIAKAESDLIQGELDYKDGLHKLNNGEADYRKAQMDAEKELKDAALKIADGEKTLADLETPEWYVLDRNANVSFVSFSINAEKVGAVAKVFPIFFFLVAALVALTTMSRMVEEERTQIGTLKALGYSKRTIILKYIVYCGLASVLGSMVGLLAGFQILPNILWNAYAMAYHLPAFLAQFSWKFAIIATLLAFICTSAATVSASHLALKEKPATLMLPRAPKAGKRIALEHIHFIWKRMKFTHKATARNLIRYKKNFFMTIIGIAGCTALIVTGFGLRDSVGDIANTQFNEIIKYDLLIELDDTHHFDTLLKDFLMDTKQADQYTEVFCETGSINKNGESITINTYVPKDSSSFKEVVNLRNRQSGAQLVFNDYSVIITEMLATRLGLKVGDTFTLKNGDEKRAEFVLTGITENYVGSYLYLNQKDYIKAFNQDIYYNTIMVKSKITDAAQQDTVLTKILTSDVVSSAQFVSQTKKTYTSLLSSINFVVIVLTMAAGGLAFIVLYNLTNININERRKELATLKVLGFHNEEVAGYIFRETSILSVIGALTGLVLGVMLHAFVIRTAETTDLMFGRNISLLSFIISVALTLIFSALVDLVMYKKLKKIKMVDSMKAVD